ncbi:colicin immunity protein [Pseudomonas citronellolis]|jgi:hypothetical protein|uniref:Colicin immunity protein n=1 Tax=Pseudomonas citronellolis TaxID=53408 RepID=A0AAW6PDD7_9PSED|nr:MULTISPECIES: colicin immunity protein [Pseudomonas]KWR76108.1 colicin immunity protein [Pseudomonas sp. PI1]MDF3845565.1 colicin immunity protein [Pseudomonas citronellolis]WRT85399.1 colicin immunity protein [Pseudomonas citronellolis]
MNIDSLRQYESADDFFALNGSAVMKMTIAAAISVCEQAINHGLIVSRIEGGIWHNPGFEARLDCIWDEADSSVDKFSAEKSNRSATGFIKSESFQHDTFIVTVSKF